MAEPWTPPSDERWTPPAEEAVTKANPVSNWFTKTLFKMPDVTETENKVSAARGTPFPVEKGPNVSVSSLADLLPMAGGALGGMSGGIPTFGLGAAPAAAIGAGGGEAIRQFLRRLGGQAPATGFGQEMLKLDPNSPLAAAVGIGDEAAGAGAVTKGTEMLGNALKNYAPKIYAGLFGPKSNAIRDELAAKIQPIFDELPVGGRGHIEKVATENAARTGKQVSDLYNTSEPSDFAHAIQNLQDKAAAEVRTPMYQPPPTFENPEPGWIPEEVKDRAKYNAFRSRAQEVANAEQNRLDSPFGPITKQDVFEARKAADEMAKRAKKTIFTPGGLLKEETPRSQALLAERAGHAQTLHETTPAVGTPGQPGYTPSGADADAAFSAWKTVEKGAKRDDPGSFPVRWAISRMLGGQVGTAAGFLATKPAFWTSIGAKGMMSVGKLLEAGNTSGADQVLRGMVDDYMQPEKQ